MTVDFKQLCECFSVVAVLGCLPMSVKGVSTPDPGPRPFIWVRQSDREPILEKIHSEAWAKQVFDAIVDRAGKPLEAYQADRDAYLRGLPVKWEATPPAFRTTREVKSRWDILRPTEARFNGGLDCATLYYLTGDEKYAAIAGDILHNAVKTLVPVKTSGGNNGGWLVHNDFLYEVRVVATQLPVIYDFLYTYLREHNVYDVRAGQEVPFDFDAAQQCFRTYYQLTCDHGLKFCNWSALMATAQLNNLLALDDPKERDEALRVYLTEGTNRQASLDFDYRVFKAPGDIGHESLQYAMAPAGIRSQHMILLDRIYPDLKLFEKYPNFPLALARPYFLRYPNNELILFGDGHRKGGGIPMSAYELLYAHTKARGLKDMAATFGGRIKAAIEAGQYDRATPRGYRRLGTQSAPLQLLWQAPEITAPPAPEIQLPRTDTLPYAGIALQRNLSPTGNPDDGLMGFVGGAAFTHGHASGMNMELYGLGQVMGCKAGRSSYSSKTHRNFYRLFAGHNTIIVNGASRGEGGWQGLGIRTVQVVSMEPRKSQPGVSKNFSFTCSSFKDDRGDMAEATQQRTLALIRTSPTTGFYVDIFRSVSTVTNRSASTLDGTFTDQYHDYIYRNIGTIASLQSGGKALTLEPRPERFQSDIGDTYQQPGWRYFENTAVSHPFAAAFRARYQATPKGGKTIAMDMILPAGMKREVAKVDSPPIVYAPEPYDKRPAQTLVVRRVGEAWDRPFVAVYEPHAAESYSTITGTELLTDDGHVAGARVETTVDGAPRVYYVISNPGPEQTFKDKKAGLTFTGRFGIVADRGDGSVELYIGDGRRLEYKGRRLTAPNGKSAGNIF